MRESSITYFKNFCHHRFIYHKISDYENKDTNSNYNDNYNTLKITTNP